MKVKPVFLRFKNGTFLLGRKTVTLRVHDDLETHHHVMLPPSGLLRYLSAYRDRLQGFLLASPLGLVADDEPDSYTVIAGNETARILQELSTTLEPIDVPALVYDVPYTLIREILLASGLLTKIYPGSISKEIASWDGLPIVQAETRLNNKEFADLLGIREQSFYYYKKKRRIFASTRPTRNKPSNMRKTTSGIKKARRGG